MNLVLQAFGMMGWRCGYLAYRDSGGELSKQLRKVQVMCLLHAEASEAVSTSTVSEGTLRLLSFSQL